MAKLIARTVMTDGDHDQQVAAKFIDASVTAYFLKRYPKM